MIKRLVFLYYIVTSLILHTLTTSTHAKPKTTGKKISIFLLDTVGREEFVYAPFMQQALQAGFKITYVPFDRFADTIDPIKTFGSAHGVFFNFGLDFMIGIQEQSPLSKKILQFFEHCVSKKDMLLGLLFPTFNTKATTGGIVNQLSPIFKPIITYTLPFPLSLLNNQQQHKTTINHFLMAADEFLIKPLVSRPCGYHTTLQSPRSGIPFYHSKLEQIVRAEEKLIMLPVLQPRDTNKYATILEKLLPFGLYWFNPVHHNHVFISSNTALTFASIKEDFHVCPVSSKLRQEMNQAVGTMLSQLKSLVHSGTIKNAHEHVALPYKKNITKKTDFPTPPTGKKTAWMEIIVFQDPLDNGNKTAQQIAQEAQERTTKQDQLISYIFDTNLDSLWISITPNIIYSPIAREKHREQQILQSISRFTKKLQVRAKKLNQVIPKILVGFEITNNIYDKNLPKYPAADLYGTTYPDLPHPLDATFWDNEIIQSLKTFVVQWNKPAISHNVQLSGIVIDLEMYCRRKSGTFLETMGFDQPTFINFMHKNALDWSSPHTPHDMINLLTKNQQCRNYFSFLEKEAETIGKNIQQAVGTIIPNGIISCYLPNILVDWFYKGFMKGLSSDHKALPLFTFNTAFKPHEPWFVKNNINAYHSSVLLLSKVKKPKDFIWINKILRDHHGIWLNRFSRLVEDHAPKEWVGVEQTSLTEDGKVEFLKYLKIQ